MPIDWGDIARDAWNLARRDREVLLPLAGLFLLLPQLALYLGVPPPPPLALSAANDADRLLLQAAGEQWLAANLKWFALTGLVTLYGGLCVLLFYLDARADTLGSAMQRALGLLPRYVLAALIVLIPAAIGGLLIIPGLYIFGRMMLVGPILAAEQPLSAVDAVLRGLRISKGRGATFMLAGTLVLLAANVLPVPFTSAAIALREAGLANPIVQFLLFGAGATIAAAISIAFLLVRIVLYRRLS